MKIRRRSPRASSLRHASAGYDPDVGPDAAAWLEMDETERHLAVEAYHRAARLRMPNVRLHAIIHAVVENQLAEGFEPVTRALARLMSEALDRHEAVHAIGSVLTGRIYSLLKDKEADSGEYLRAVEELTAEKWRKSAR
jgi:hypothetical protein